MQDNLKPEQRARVKIDKQLNKAGWDIVERDEYISGRSSAIREALMKGNDRSDYLLFVDDKAIAVVEAKKEKNPLGEEVEKQAEKYSVEPQKWYGLWFNQLIPLVYLANGEKIYFKNLLVPDSDYEEIKQMHSPKKMLQIIEKTSVYGALPMLDRKGLRDCQYDAVLKLEDSLRDGNKKNLAILATGAGKTYLACLATYRLLNYTNVKRVLFLVDRNNLGRQAETEFNKFSLTEQGIRLSSLYDIKKLKKEDDINNDIVISTIQKLYALIVGEKLTDVNEDEEDEKIAEEEEFLEENNDVEFVKLCDNPKLPSDYFDLIIVDECHRSIYGKWKAVLDYFKDAKVFGLTATPTPDAIAYFNNNIIANYTYDDAVVEGINVPYRIFRIETEKTSSGGTITSGTEVSETSKKKGTSMTYTAKKDYTYGANELDRTVTDKAQIKKVLETYRDSIYSDLYPERNPNWNYIPKTLIFAKDDRHASNIVEVIDEVFKIKFEDNKLPDGFAQKITYTAGDTDRLIQNFRDQKEFRIAVTVTLVSTGTDIKPLEVVLFMKDVHSSVLYTQMKGRACRDYEAGKLREVTPNADSKDCYYIVDAVGVTESEKNIPEPGNNQNNKRTLSLEQLLERLSHNELSDENLFLLRDYCAVIHRQYEQDNLFRKHLDYFIDEYGFSPRGIASKIQEAFDEGNLDEFISSSEDNLLRKRLIGQLTKNLDARKKLVEMKKGYHVTIDDNDVLIYAGFSKEDAKSYIESFEKYIYENKDRIEALRIIYNSESVLITNSMLIELRDSLIAENSQFKISRIWKNYQLLDDEGNVDELDVKSNVNALTNLIQIVRFAYGKNSRLTSLIRAYGRGFGLYCGYNQRILTREQQEVMKQIAEYVVEGGAISLNELNEIDTNLWRSAVKSFDVKKLKEELTILEKFILKVA